MFSVQYSALTVQYWNLLVRCFCAFSFFFYFCFTLVVFCISGGKRVFPCSRATAQCCTGEYESMWCVLQRLTEFHDFSSFWSSQVFMTLWYQKMLASPCEKLLDFSGVLASNLKVALSPKTRTKYQVARNSLASNLRAICEPVRKKQPRAIWVLGIGGAAAHKTRRGSTNDHSTCGTGAGHGSTSGCRYSP